MSVGMVSKSVSVPKKTKHFVTNNLLKFCASYLYSVENCEIAIFSTGRRASQKLLELINSLICKLPGGKERIIKYNQEVLNMCNYDGSYGQSKLSSYPSNAKTLRGVGADIVM